jgi:hypothetical protein
MSKRMLDPKVRQIVMQGVLVLVFAGAVGLAALVTRHVRMSMRVELGEARTFGRLVAKLPAKWLSSPATVEKGDAIEAEEPPTELQAGRRLRLMRQKSDGLVSPLEHLLRSGLIKPEALKALSEGREGYSLTNVTVGGWPGQMLTMTDSPRPGVLHKDVVACATLPSSQALVVELEGLGPLDASDRELVRQMSENVWVAMEGPAGEAAGTVELVDQIKVQAPPRFVAVGEEDPNVLQRQLLFDGSRAGWAAVDLTSCIFFEDDTDETFLAMLAARDSDWRGGRVKHIGPRTLMVDRAEGPGVVFPSRAYLTANGDGRALLGVMRGGVGDRGLFDPAWREIGASVKFTGSKDLSALLVNGAEAARRVGEETLAEMTPGAVAQDWYMWDASENSDKELWSQMNWQVSQPGDGPVTITGSRTSKLVDAYSNDTAFSQEWTAAGDLSKYQVTTNREVRRTGNQFPKQTPEQRVTVENGRMTLASFGGRSQPDAATPSQYVPGALLPMVVRELADKPSLIKTESFVGLETVAPSGLLTLFVTRLSDPPTRKDENGDPMECVTVSVNGTGEVSRWYYSGDHVLRFIDFAGGMKAQSGGK